MPPLISVVVPSYKRRELLRACLASLALQDLPPTSFEVIVVLDGSRDGSAEMARTLPVPFALHVIEQANAGVGAARNTGARAASAPYLVFFDDDMAIAPGTVRAHLEAQQAMGGVLAVGSISTTATHRGYPQFAISFWKDIERNRGRRPLLFTAMFGGNLSVPAAAWREAGGFDESLRWGEDSEFAYRLQEAGCTFAFVAEASTHQSYTKSTRACLSDSISGGKAGVELWRRYPEMRRHLRVSWLGTAPPASRLALRATLAFPVPMAPFIWLGVLPNVWPVRRLYQSIANYWYMKGARAEALKGDSWSAITARRPRPPG